MEEVEANGVLQLRVAVDGDVGFQPALRPRLAVLRQELFESGLLGSLPPALVRSSLPPT